MNFLYRMIFYRLKKTPPQVWKCEHVKNMLKTFWEQAQSLNCCRHKVGSNSENVALGSLNVFFFFFFLGLNGRLDL
jgi:hypothetical protein